MEFSKGTSLCESAFPVELLKSSGASFEGFLYSPYPKTSAEPMLKYILFACCFFHILPCWGFLSISAGLAHREVGDLS